MRHDKLSRQNVILYLCGVIPVVWIALLIAPVMKDGLPGLISNFGAVMENPFHILLIAIPLTIQTFLIFFIAYRWAKTWKLPHSIASPAGMIGASNFFELAVAVAISLFGLHSGAALATVVGVLVEVPIMLTLVKISNKTKHLFND